MHLNQAQADYIDKLKSDGVEIEEGELRKMLAGAGWPDFEVEEAIFRLRSTPVATSIPVPPSIKENIVFQEPVTNQESTSVTETNTTSEQQLPETPLQSEENNNKTELIKKVILIAGILLAVAVIGVGAYFISGDFLTPKTSLTNENLLPTIYEKLSDINTTNYDVTFSLGVGPRDADARSYDELFPLSVEEVAKYQRDYDRLRDIAKIKEVLDAAKNDSYIKKTKTNIYPKSLDAIGLVSKDASGNPYLYRPSADYSTYTLSVTLETKEAYASLNMSNYGVDSSSTDSLVATINQDSYVSTYGFDGKPNKPKLFGFMDLEDVEEYIPDNLAANFTLGGSIDNQVDKPTNARLRVGGEVSFGDASFAFDAEGLKREDRYYAIVNKIPSFFSAFSQIRGKWIGFTEADLRNYGYSEVFDYYVPSEKNERQQIAKEAGERFKTALNIAAKHQVVKISSGPIEEMVGEDEFTRYTLKLEKANLLPFVEETFLEFKDTEYGYSDRERSELIEYLKSEEFNKSFDYLSENVTFTIWFDAEGYPAKFTQSFRYIPSASARALNNSQINLSLSLTLSGINKNLQVEEPAGAITFDELMMEITGKSMDEILLDKQKSNVTTLRQSLREYHEWTGQYPVSLDGLKLKRKDVTKAESTSVVGSSWSTNSEYTSYFDDQPFVKTLPDDVFSNGAYGYEVKGDYYELKYQVKITSYTKDKNPADYYTAVRKSNSSQNTTDNLNYYYVPDEESVWIPKFVDGVNTATEVNLSKEAETNKADTDGDGLADALEKILGTDPNKADTDGDGYHDREELKSNSNPTGPGLLEYKRSSSGLFF